MNLSDSGGRFPRNKFRRIATTPFRWCAHDAIAVLSYARPNRDTIKSISDSSNGFEIDGIIYIGFDFFPNPPNARINTPGRYEMCVSPDSVKEYVAAESMSAVSGKIVHKSEFESCCRNLKATNR